MSGTTRAVADPDKVAEIAGGRAMVRRETIRLIGIAESGHYTSVFSAAEILATLYSGVMRIAEDPDWPERDRLILSKGHVAVGVYPLLAERGYIAPELLDAYTRLGNPSAITPICAASPGSTSPRGRSATACRSASAWPSGPAARLRRRRIWVLLGDQELNEGQIWERLGRSHFRAREPDARSSTATRWGSTGAPRRPWRWSRSRRFEAFGWNVLDVDGHDGGARCDVQRGAAAHERQPTCVVARTVKGKGVDYMELSRSWHLGYLAPADASCA